MLIDLIAGARPNFVKIAPIIHALRAHEAAGGRLRYRLVHTGQHYDSRMSQDFFNQLEIPAPDINLKVGSGTQAEQTGIIMNRYEALLGEKLSNLCLVVGDVTSTMACSIVARKAGIAVAHVEAGIRSGDWDMPEEINRVVTDSITSWFFTTTPQAGLNLISSGINDARIFFVGNTMIDTLVKNIHRFEPPKNPALRGLESGDFIVVTLHRPSNVDDPTQFAKLLRAILENSYNVPLVFPVHPRSRRTLERLGALSERLILIDPQPYLQFNWLVKNARAVITDSGGVTEETTVMGIPCLTLRTTTERPETVTLGTNELLGTDVVVIAEALKRLFSGDWKSGQIPEKWDGCTAERIVYHLNDLLHI
jgi:UDP-N-acetylglucosamine 2-epimerase (non-hydrolysing)